MMARSDDLARIQRVNGVRKVRLSRALTLAQHAAQQAEREMLAAQAEEARMAAQLEAAKAAMADNPACPQTRLWREVSSERRVEARDAVMTADEQRVEARDLVKERTHAVRNHELRAQKIDEHGRSLRRGEARMKEILTEDDLVPSSRGSIHG